MAGDWIKMRHDLAEDPATIGIALRLGLEVDLVVGKLHRLWSWADRQTEDGRVRNVSASWVDTFATQPGFAAAMAAEEWLRIDPNGGIELPNFARHNGASAKRRAADSQRKRDSRSRPQSVRKVSAKSRTKTVTREEKRRVESTEEERTPDQATLCVQDSTVAPASRAVVSAAARRETWITPFAEAWRARTGGDMAIEPALRPLSKLRREHGEPKVLQAWCRYLGESDATFLGAAAFASKFGLWSGAIRPQPGRGQPLSRDERTRAAFAEVEALDRLAVES